MVTTKNKKKKKKNLAAHTSSNEIMSSACSRRKLALVSEDYHYQHLSGGLSDSVGMHFFCVFVVVL